MSQEYQLQAHGEDAMVALGMRFGQVLSATAPGVTVFLQGDLGMGKTTFTRGIMRHFGHQGATKSPTYTLVEPYQFKQQKVHHFDLYRLGHPEELEYLGIRDYFDGSAINLIEWPDKGRGFLPNADVVLTIHPLERGRKLTFVAQTNMGDGVLVHLGKVKQ
jgi:tRNA threonylcarbamoyladenosine biosynthesis protein TsaE